MMMSFPVFCVMTSCQGISVQGTSASGVVDQEKSLQGSLSNGLYYHITANSYDVKKASLRLVVKVGSVLEEEEERGLAHFLEHMVFRGSQNFADGEVIKYLESIGAAFGPDTNAYTSYDETVYMLDIPLDKENGLETAVSILSEFADRALLTQEILDIEKSVVLDELRQRDNHAAGRSGKKFLETFLENTPYGERHPIGLEAVITSCPSAKIQHYYKKWYRPENMALIAVGDFDQSQVLSLVEKYFGSIAPQENPQDIKPAPVESFHGNVVKIYEDPEATYSYYVFGDWLPTHPLITREDFKEEFLTNLICSMANRRFSILSQQDPSPFQMGFMGAVRWISASKLFFNQCVCWDDHPIQGLDTMLLECEKMRQQEFTAQELLIAKESAKAGAKASLDNAGKHKNGEYAARYVAQFLGRLAPFSFEEEAQTNLALLEEVTLDEVNAYKKRLLQREGQVTCFFPSAKAATVSQDAIFSCIEQERKFADQEEEEATFGLKTEPTSVPGTIVASKVYDANRVRELELSNGMKVYLQKTDLKKNLFSMSLQAKGGLDSYDEKVAPSASVAFPYLMRSGLAGLSSTQLQDALAGKHVSINYMLLLHSRLIQISAANDDMKEACRLLHALFTERTYRQEAWSQYMKMTDQMFATKKQSPDMQFFEDVSLFNTSHHYLCKSYSSENMSKEQAETVLQEAFGDPSEYTLVVIGDYDEEKLLTCLEKYVAAIPARKISFPAQKTTNFIFPSGKNHRDLQYPSVGEEVTIFWSSPIDTSSYQQTADDFYHIALADTIMQNRLLKKLRMKEGETYVVQCMTLFPFAPSMASSRYTISFSSSPKAAKSMEQLLLDELENSRKTPPTEEEIRAAEQVYKHRLAKELQTNEGRAKKLLEQLSFGDAPSSFFVTKQAVASSEKIHQAMQSLVHGENYSLHIKHSE